MVGANELNLSDLTIKLHGQFFSALKREFSVFDVDVLDLDLL